MTQEELLKKILNLLSLDLNLFKESIKEVSEDIIKEGFSKFPIFVAHRGEIKLGEMILDKDELGTTFSIQASTLEEFVEKKIVLAKNEGKFKATYKNPETHICIFLITELGGQFVFIPYEITKPATETP
jgi:hypothetical protein